MIWFFFQAGVDRGIQEKSRDMKLTWKYSIIKVDNKQAGLIKVNK